MPGNRAITPYPDVNDILQILISGVRDVLGDQLLGMYLEGSLTGSDFDQDSDIDFVVVTQDEISEETFLALQEMHDRVAVVDSVWAIQLEGSYLSRRAIRRYDPAFTLYPNIERGRGERLKLVEHDDWWCIHQYILRERGITILGPDPKTLIDPVSSAQLRQASLRILNGWAVKILEQPAVINGRGYQTYTVLTICRILYTLENGAVASKATAARWAQETLGQQWFDLIERAWEGRHTPDQDASPEDIQGTLDLIRFALKKSAG